MARVRSVSSYEVTMLSAGWQLATTPPGAMRDPVDLEAARPDWIAARVPTTAAATLSAAGNWSLDDGVDLDGLDVWMRTTLPAADGGDRRLRFDGLATLCDAWLDGAHLLRSENMFVSRSVDVTGRSGELLLRFASLARDLERKRPRPRWKAPLISHQQLRWHRATLFGRLRGWWPAVAMTGPWRPVALERRARVSIDRCDLRTRLEERDGIASVALSAHALPIDAPPSTTLASRALPSNALSAGVRSADPLAAAPILRGELSIGSATCELRLRPAPAGTVVLEGELRLPAVAAWWPSTHGEPALYPARVRLWIGSETEPVEVDLGRVGFRRVEVDAGGGGFALRLNGTRIFARGSNWAPLDLLQPGGDEAAYRGPLTDARDAGMNLLRVPAHFPYEADAFFDLCDELGLLVWQDFAFANLDFPIDDPAFAASVREEVRCQLDRLQAHPSLAVLCGGSDAYQQPAMLGLPQGAWKSELFESVLPAEVAALCPDTPYVPNSPSGGALPFRPDTLAAPYYGVGAYRRPLEDARRSEVRFATECLGFGNVPARATHDRLLGQGVDLFQWSEWKRRIPWDVGASSDFDDVRDYYLAALYRVDPVELRSSDFDRYLQLSSAASGEAMEAVFAEWRRGRSTCRGGLVWLHRDQIDGTRFGVTDSQGHPKPAWWFLQRAFRPRAIFLADEGLNGLRVHAINDRGAPLQGSVELTAFRGAAVVESGRKELTIAPHAEVELESDALLPRFIDITYAYRFGPPAHDLVTAALRDAAGEVLSEAFYFPLGRPCERRGDLGLTARTRPLPDGCVELALATVRHAQSISLEVEPPETRLEDNWFHLRPGAERRIRLRPPSGARVRGHALALNAELPVRFAETT